MHQSQQGFNSFGSFSRPRWADENPEEGDGVEQLQKRTEILLQKIMNTPLGGSDSGYSPPPHVTSAPAPPRRSDSVTPQPLNGMKTVLRSSYEDSPPAYGAHAFSAPGQREKGGYDVHSAEYRRPAPPRKDDHRGDSHREREDRSAESARQRQRYDDRERREASLGKSEHHSNYQQREKTFRTQTLSERPRAEPIHTTTSKSDWWREDERDERAEYQPARRPSPPTRSAYDSGRRDEAHHPSARESASGGPFNRSSAVPQLPTTSADSRKRNRDAHSSDDRSGRGDRGREGRWAPGGRREGEGGDGLPSYAASMATSGPQLVRDSAASEAHRIPSRKFWLLGLPPHATVGALRQDLAKYADAQEVNILKVAGEVNGVGIAVLSSVNEANTLLTRAAEYGQQGKLEKYNLCVRLLGVDVQIFLHSSAGPERRGAWAKTQRAELVKEGWLIDKECGEASTFQNDCGIVITSGIPTFATPTHIRYLVKSILETTHVGRTNIGPVMSMDCVTDICVQAPDNAKLQTKPTVQVLFSSQAPRLKILLALQNRHVFLSNKPEESRLANNFNEKRGDPIAIRCLVAEVIPLAKHGMVLRQLLGGAVDEVINQFEKSPIGRQIELTRLTYAWKTAYVNQIFNNYRRVDLRGYNNLYLVATRIHNAMYPTSTKIEVDGQQVDLVPPGQGKEFFAILGQAISRLWAQDRQKFTDYCQHVLGPEWQRLMFASDMMHVDGFIRTEPLDRPQIKTESIVEGESLDLAGMTAASAAANCVTIDARLEDDSSEYSED